MTDLDSKLAGNPWRPKERLAATALAGILAFTYPLLELFDRPVLVFGVPLLYLYLFTLWVCLIVGIALLLEKMRRPAVSDEQAETLLRDD